MPAGDSVRTFVAVMVGPEARRRIGKLEKEIASELPEFRWSAPDQLHATLAFLGDVSSRRLPEVVSAANAVQALAPFSIRWQGLGCFPRPRRAGVLWMGLGDGAAPFIALFRSLAASLADAGFQPDRRFTPHATLARSKRFRGTPTDLSPIIDRFRGRDFGEDRVESVVVMQSDPSPRGSIYSPIATIPLASA